MGSVSVIDDRGPGSDYTWLSSSFVWTDDQATRTWASAHVSEFVATVSEGLEFSKVEEKGVTLAPFNVLLGFANPVSKQSNRVIQTALRLTALRASGVSRTISEAFAFHEAKVISRVITLLFSTALAISNPLKRATARTILENMALAEARSTGFSRPVAERLRLSESRKQSIIHRISVVLGLTEPISKKTSRTVSSSFGFSEARASGFSRKVNESFGLAEVFSQWRAMSRLFSVSLGMTEERKPYTFSKALSTRIGASDALNRSAIFGRIFATSLAMAPKLKRGASKTYDEAFAFHETRKPLNFRKAVLVALGMNEGNIFTKGFIRNFQESLGLTVTQVKEPGKVIKVALRAIGYLLRNANAVISDIKLRKTALTAASFEDILKNDAPAGFSDFVPFRPGDYAYQKAVLRTTIEALSGSTPRLDAMRLLVDVPDRTDRGSLTVDAVGSSVVFARGFSTTDELEVTATLKGGTVVAIPRISALTKDGFHIELIDPSTGAGVSGDVSWIAQGY